MQRCPALYATIGNRFGGDERKTFALPKMDDPLPGARYVMAIDGWFRPRDEHGVWAPNILAFAKEWLGAPPAGTVHPTGQILNLRDNRPLLAVIGYAFAGGS